MNPLRRKDGRPIGPMKDGATVAGGGLAIVLLARSLGVEIEPEVGVFVAALVSAVANRLRGALE